MSRNTIYILIAIFLIAVAGMFLVSYVMQDDTVEPGQSTQDTAEETKVEPDVRERITAKQFYIDGVHTLVGEINMPTPCDLLEYDVVIQESMPEQVSIDFTVINNAETCAQVITPQRFMVEVTASEEAVFYATLRGEQVELNLVPAAAGETPEEFELFIKG